MCGSLCHNQLLIAFITSWRIQTGSAPMARVNSTNSTTSSRRSHGEADKGCDGSGVALEIAGEASVVADPGEDSFDHPALEQDVTP
jgi:hypothetical protein